MSAARWAGAIAIAIFSAIVLIWCAAVVAWDDNWGTSITEWHLYAVAVAAIAALVFSLRGGTRAISMERVFAFAFGLAAGLGAIFIVGGT